MKGCQQALSTLESCLCLSLASYPLPVLAPMMLRSKPESLHRLRVHQVAIRAVEVRGVAQAPPYLPRIQPEPNDITSVKTHLIRMVVLPSAADDFMRGLARSAGGARIRPSPGSSQTSFRSSRLLPSLAGGLNRKESILVLPAHLLQA